MPNRYLPALIQFAQEDLPQLEYDLLNATNIFTLQEAAKKMHNIVQYLVHTAILDIGQRQGLPVAAAPQPVAQAPAPRATMPALPFQRQEPVASHTTEVFVTATGTRVQVPGQPAMALPPGAAVDTTQFAPAMRQAPSFPPVMAGGAPAPVAIVLPQGGELSPEVSAALAGRSTGAPIMDGARDITHDPAA